MTEGQSITVADVLAQVHDRRLEDFVGEAVAFARAGADGGRHLGRVRRRARGHPAGGARDASERIPAAMDGSFCCPGRLSPTGAWPRARSSRVRTAFMSRRACRRRGRRSPFARKARISRAIAFAVCAASERASASATQQSSGSGPTWAAADDRLRPQTRVSERGAGRSVSCSGRPAAGECLGDDPAVRRRDGPDRARDERSVARLSEYRCCLAGLSLTRPEDTLCPTATARSRCTAGPERGPSVCICAGPTSG
jgi:hypothetical protein